MYGPRRRPALRIAIYVNREIRRRCYGGNNKTGSISNVPIYEHTIIGVVVVGGKEKIDVRFKLLTYRGRRDFIRRNESESRLRIKDVWVDVNAKRRKRNSYVITRRRRLRNRNARRRKTITPRPVPAETAVSRVSTYTQVPGIPRCWSTPIDQKLGLSGKSARDPSTIASRRNVAGMYARYSPTNNANRSDAPTSYLRPRVFPPGARPDPRTLCRLFSCRSPRFSTNTRPTVCRRRPTVPPPGAYPLPPWLRCSSSCPL